MDTVFPVVEPIHLKWKCHYRIDLAFNRSWPAATNGQPSRTWGSHSYGGSASSHAEMSLGLVKKHMVSMSTTRSYAGKKMLYLMP